MKTKIITIFCLILTTVIGADNPEVFEIQKQGEYVCHKCLPFEHPTERPQRFALWGTSLSQPEYVSQFLKGVRPGFFVGAAGALSLGTFIVWYGYKWGQYDREMEKKHLANK